MKRFISLLTVSFCCFNIAYAQAGQLDPSFGNKGVVLTDFKDASVNIYGATGTQVLKASDGAIYLIFEISNSYALITRLHTNGAIDTSYANNGYSQYVRMVAKAAALQGDGKIVMAGYIQIDFTDEYHLALARFNTDGSLDATFSEDGKQTIDFGSLHDMASSIAIQSDGKIVVAGFTISWDSTSSNFALARFNIDGTLDTTFHEDGKQITDFGGGENAQSVAVQSDGKIVVAGRSGGGFALARYNTDGTLDKTFSVDGKQITEFAGGDGARSLAIQNDGKIVVAGSSKGDFALVRYNTDGILDKTFSEDGIQTTDFASADIGSCVAIESDGKLVVTGSSLAEIRDDPEYPNNKFYIYDFAIARYNIDGRLDSTFSQDGKQTTDFTGGDDNAISLAMLNDGKITVAGSNIKNYNPSNGISQTYFALAQYNTDASLDSAFSEDGKLTDYLHLAYTYYSDVAVQSDGKIVVLGRNQISDSTLFALFRYNANGALDTTFSSDGKVNTPIFAEDVAIQNDGKIVVVGSAYRDESFDDFVLARYNADGTLDTSFSTDGMQETDFGGSGDGASTLSIQGDGKIVVAGAAYVTGHSADFAVARYNSDGTLDPTFSEDGKQTAEVGGYGGGAKSVVIQSDGKIVLVGTANIDNGYDFALVRFNTDGTFDDTFSEDGKQTTDFAATGDFAFSAAIGSNGKIAVAGTTGDDFAVARYDTNGSLDSTFSEDGKQTTDFGSAFEMAYSVAIQSDGKIIVGGNNETNFALARYNLNGSLDNDFGVNGKQVTDASGSYDYINEIAISGDKLYAVGSGSHPGSVGVIARYVLENKSQMPPAVDLTTPANNATYLAPAAYIKLSATATDADGSITKVEFYNGDALLHTETIALYGFKWRGVPIGNYTLTAKAYDNSGLSTTSAPVQISVVPNKPPVVSIIKPKNNEPFAPPAYIHFEAAASDTDGRITRVEFYNGSTLLNTQYQFPYTFVWQDVPVGTYIITAVATDNWGAHTTSVPVTFRVISNVTIVSSKLASVNNKKSESNAISFTIAPNPANTTINLYTTGLQPDKRATIRILSASGVLVRTMGTISLIKTIRLDVSLLPKGVYTIKLISGDSVLYKQFVKL